MTNFFRLSGIVALCALLFYTPGLSAKELRGRLGVGATGQLRNGISAASVKIQRSNTFAIGAVVGAKFSDSDSGYGVGVKVYRIVFDEPQLNFYVSAMAALLNNEVAGTSYGGFQLDGTFGSEFHFTGMESIGFSFEFGISANKIQENFTLESVGDHFVTAAIHFYL